MFGLVQQFLININIFLWKTINKIRLDWIGTAGYFDISRHLTNQNRCYIDEVFISQRASC